MSSCPGVGRGGDHGVRQRGTSGQRSNLVVLSVLVGATPMTGTSPESCPRSRALGGPSVDRHEPVGVGCKHLDFDENSRIVVVRPRCGPRNSDGPQEQWCPCPEHSDRSDSHPDLGDQSDLPCKRDRSTSSERVPVTRGEPRPWRHGRSAGSKGPRE